MFMTNSYFVLAKEKPKLQKLKNLLEMNLYCGKAYEQNNDATKVVLDFENYRFRNILIFIF